jgi:hypothetical protein
MKISGGLLAAIVFGFLALVCGMSYVSNYNYGNMAEKRIVAQHEDLTNILGQYSLRIKEAAQVPSMQAEDLASLYTGALDARYGAEGSQAAMQWIREQNPNLDQSTYRELQQMIQGGRAKFENSQSRFLDTKRTYETALGSFWQGMWLGIAGYPKIDLDDYEIVTSQYAADAFETGIEEGLQLR